MNHYVYKIIDPKTGQYYIGVRSCDCDPQNDTYMGSYTTWNPNNKLRLEKEIISSNFKTREEANKHEKELIEDNINNKLNENYYIPSEGFHSLGCKLSEEHKKKLSEAKKGDKNPKYWLGKKRDMRGENHPLYGKKRKKEVKEKIRKSLKGRKYSKERRRNISNSLKGKKCFWYNKNHSKETKNKISQSKNKKVKHIKSGRIFKSQKEASKELQVSKSTVSHHCTGKRKNPKFEFVKQ